MTSFHKTVSRICGRYIFLHTLTLISPSLEPQCTQSRSTTKPQINRPTHSAILPKRLRLSPPFFLPFELDLAIDVETANDVMDQPNVALLIWGRSSSGGGGIAGVVKQLRCVCVKCLGLPAVRGAKYTALPGAFNTRSLRLPASWVPKKCVALSRY